jgi:glycosyltransferase involved in cell wall biosynthesis
MRIGLDVAQTCVERLGCGWVADRIATAMSEVCPEDELILYHQFGNLINWNTSKGTVIDRPNVSSPFLRSSWLNSKIAWKRIQLNKAELPGNPEIVHSHCFQAPFVGSARLIYTVYDLSIWTHPEFTTELNRLNCQHGMLDAIHYADGLVFISESSRRDFFQLFPGLDQRKELATTVVLLGSRFPYIKEARSSFSQGTWLSVGSLEPRKNFDVLLDALQIYWEQSKTRRKLRIAGGKGWKSEATWNRTRDFERRGMMQHLGYVPDTELERLYREAFALVFPSHYEGFGLPLIEAMSQACPVITSTNASLPEVGGDAVLYWDGKSAESLAAEMLRLEREETYYVSLSIKSLARAHTFSWEKAARELRRFYQEVVERVQPEN